MLKLFGGTVAAPTQIALRSQTTYNFISAVSLSLYSILSPKSPQETSKVSDGEKTPTHGESQAPWESLTLGESLSVVNEELSAHKQQKKETTPSAKTDDNEVIIFSRQDFVVLGKENA